MERKRYLAMCERYAAVRDERGEVSGAAEREVLCQWICPNAYTVPSVLAYPVAYRLEYAKGADGETKPAHRAVLKVWGAAGEITVPLDSVEPLAGEEAEEHG